MKNTYSKKELEEQSLEVIKKYTEENEVFAREDGNVFFSENHAQLECGKLKIFKFTREELVKNIEVNLSNEKVGKATGELGKATTAPVEGSTKELATKKQELKKATEKVNTTTGKDGKNPETRTNKPT